MIDNKLILCIICILILICLILSFIAILEYRQSLPKGDVPEMDNGLTLKVGVPERVCGFEPHHLRHGCLAQLDKSATLTS